MKSIALPALLGSELKLAPETIARIIYECVENTKFENGSLTDVRIVMHEDDESASEVRK